MEINKKIIISKILELIKEKEGQEIDIEAIPQNDEKTFEKINDGRVFIPPFDSRCMLEHLEQFELNSIEGLINMFALDHRSYYKVSIEEFIANKNNPELIEYLHPMIEPILKNTYGFLMYKEQLIQILQKLGGFSYEEADLARKNLGKAKMVEMEKISIRFIDSCAKNNIDKEISEAIFDSLWRGVSLISKSYIADKVSTLYKLAWLYTYYQSEVYDILYGED